MDNYFQLDYRKYEPGDQIRIIELYNLVFHKTLSLSEWKWAYQRNPIERYDIILALFNSRIIGQSAGSPQEYLVAGTSRKTSRIQNVMVHPDFRKQGIFLETLKLLTSYLYYQAIDFVVTFPNDSSLQAFIHKLDYRHIEDLYTYFIPATNPQSPTSNLLEFVISEKLNFVSLDVLLASEYLQESQIYNNRSLEYLNWRYHANSGKLYRLLRLYEGGSYLGWVVFKYYPEDNSIDLVEFFCPGDEYHITQVLTSIRNFYFALSVNIVGFNIWLRREYWYHRSLINLGAQRTNQKTHVVFRDFSNGFSTREIEKKFYLSMSDSDVY